MKFQFIEPGGTRSAFDGAAEGIRISLCNAKKVRRSSYRVRLGTDVMKKLRWMTGDRVVIGFDRESRMVKVMRVSGVQRGYKLSNLNGSKKKTTGEVAASDFRLQARQIPSDIESILSDILRSGSYQTEDYIVEHDGVMFDWPHAKEGD